MPAKKAGKANGKPANGKAAAAAEESEEESEEEDDEESEEEETPAAPVAGKCAMTLQP